METAHTYHRILKNSFVLVALRVVEPLLAMVVIIAISRLMGVDTLGGYAFIISFVAMFGTVGQMGLQTLVTREVAANRDKSSSYLSGALLIGLGSSVILGAAMVLSTGFFGLAPEVSRAVSLISLNLFPMFALSVFEAVFLGFERTDLIAWQQVLGNLFRVGVSLLFIFLGFGLVSLVVAIIASTSFAVAISVYTYLRYLAKGPFTFNPAVCLHLLKSSPVFLLATLVWILWMRLDVLFLTKLSGIAQVALYAAAYKLFEGTMIIPQSYTKASFPHLSALYRSKSRLFGEANRNMLRDILFYVFPATALIVGLAPFLISVLYGSRLAQAAPVLQILMIGLIPWTAGRIFANILVAANRQKYDLLSAACALPVSIGLNFFLVPSLGAQGAAIASAASLSAFFLCQLLCTVKTGLRVSVAKAAWRPLLLGCAVFLVVRIGCIGWPYALVECLLMLLGCVLYLKSSENRRRIMRPLGSLQQIMRA